MYNKEYYEKIKDKRKAYYELNKEILKEKRKAYYELNKQKEKDYVKNYRKLKKDKINLINNQQVIEN